MSNTAEEAEPGGRTQNDSFPTYPLRKNTHAMLPFGQWNLKYAFKDPTMLGRIA